MTSDKVIRQRITKDEYGSVESFYCKIEVLDHSHNIVSRQIFDEHERIVKSMMYFYQNGQNIGRAVMGIEGTPVRCPVWEEESFAYYKLYFTKDFNNQFASAIGVNEWEENSIFYDYYDMYKYGRIILEDFNQGELYSEKYGKYPLKTCRQKIRIPDKYVTDVSIPYIHILGEKSPLYTMNNGNGLKDGDRIIRLGSWSWQQPENLLASEWKKIGKEQIDIVVLRPTAEGLSRKSLTLSTMSDGDSKLAEYHLLALTENELQMINNI